MELKPAVKVAAVERAGVWVVFDEGGGESGGDYIKGVGKVVVVGGSVGSNVTEWNIHVAIGIEVGEGEDVVVGEGLLRGVDGGGL